MSREEEKSICQQLNCFMSPVVICSMTTKRRTKTVTMPVVGYSVITKTLVFFIHVVIVLIRHITGIMKGLEIISVTD